MIVPGQASTCHFLAMTSPLALGSYIGHNPRSHVSYSIYVKFDLTILIDCSLDSNFIFIASTRLPYSCSVDQQSRLWNLQSRSLLHPS
ncbi:hypothetical protein DFH29DRAFT_916686 [Suillus ampliporus]|nr:hypothetical protein DFH29DRAFT_916686 [Suillus ampliporus]